VRGHRRRSCRCTRRIGRHRGSCWWWGGRGRMRHDRWGSLTGGLELTGQVGGGASEHHGAKVVARLFRFLSCTAQPPQPFELVPGGPESVGSFERYRNAIGIVGLGGRHCRTRCHVRLNHWSSIGGVALAPANFGPDFARARVWGQSTDSYEPVPTKAARTWTLAGRTTRLPPAQMQPRAAPIGPELPAAAPADAPRGRPDRRDEAGARLASGT
jgi:hypothetical protein